MKIYLVSDDNKARQIRQLLNLNSECAKLHWSKTIEIPANVLCSLETLESFVEEKIYELCDEKTFASSLDEDEETAIMNLIRKNPELRATLGTGVVIADIESKNVAQLLDGKDAPKALLLAINSGKNIVLF